DEPPSLVEPGADCRWWRASRAPSVPPCLDQGTREFIRAGSHDIVSTFNLQDSAQWAEPLGEPRERGVLAQWQGDVVDRVHVTCLDLPCVDQLVEDSEVELVREISDGDGRHSRIDCARAGQV